MQTTFFYHLMYMTLYEVLEEGHTKVKLGRSCPQEVTLVPFLFFLGLISSPTFLSCCFFLCWEHSSLFFCYLNASSPGHSRRVLCRAALTHCCWERVFGPSCPIIRKHQELWKSSYPTTQQSHFKRFKRDRDSFRILFTKTSITILFVLWITGIMQVSTEEKRWPQLCRLPQIKKYSAATKIMFGRIFLNGETLTV